MQDLVVYGRLDALQERVTRLEQALQAVAAAAGVTLPDEAVAQAPAVAGDPVTEEIAALLRAGQRVQAVKVASQKLKLSLLDATDYVGRLEGTL